jgi:hypothetical protein
MLSTFKKRLDIEDTIVISLEAAHTHTAAHRENWRLGEEKTWNLDQNHGQILFSFADGMQALAPVQIIGTLNPDDEMFTWAWRHPTVLAALQKNALRVKAFGKQHRAGELIKKSVPCTEQRAWEYTALAMHLNTDHGVYRAKANNGTLVFMNFGEVLLTHLNPAKLRANA